LDKDFITYNQLLLFSISALL